TQHAELRALPLRLHQRLGPAHRRAADDFERVEAGFLQQLQLADVVEAVELVDEAAVAARADAPAPVLVLVQETHPETEVLLPLDLVLRRPVEPVGAVRLAARLVELPERRNGVALM